MIVEYTELRSLDGKTRYIDLQTGKETKCICPDLRELTLYRGYSRDCEVHGEINNPNLWR